MRDIIASAFTSAGQRCSALRVLYVQREIADRVSISMGLATLHDSKPANPDQLIAHADSALYSAKQARGTNIMNYQPQDTNAPAA